MVDLLAARMASNASLYLFASPAMASRVEIEISQRLHVLNHLVWRKGAPGRRSTSQGNKADKASLRAWWPESERIVFAEHYNSDNAARGESSYVRACDELRGFIFEPIRAYLDAEREAAGSTGHAALMLGRRFIGIERDPAIFDQACERLSAFHSQLSLI